MEALGIEPRSAMWLIAIIDNVVKNFRADRLFETCHQKLSPILKKTNQLFM